MTGPVGHVTIELLARVGEAEPQSMGFVQVPITVKSLSTGRLEIDLSQHIGYVAEDLKAVFGRDGAGPRGDREVPA